MMTVDENGQFWAADPYNNAVWKLKVGAEPERDPTPASVTAKSRDGGLLLPWKRDIEHRYHGKIDKIAMPEVPDKDGRPQDLMVLGLTDDGKRLWLMTVQAGLFLKNGDGPWLPRSKYKLPPKIVMGTPGAKPGHTLPALTARLCCSTKMTSKPSIQRRWPAWRPASSPMEVSLSAVTKAWPP
jgi:hypothetical protein